MAGYATPMPPMPPHMAQQASPMSQMIESQMGAQSGAMDQKAASMQFVQGQMNQAAESFGSVAKVLAVVSPELMPLMEKIMQGAAILTSEIQKAMQQGAGPSTPGYPNQVSREGPESASGSVSMS